MRTRRIAKLLCAAVALCAGLPASAATVTVDWTVDLNTVNLSGSTASTNGFFSPVSVSSGDTIDFTLRFAGNQALQTSNLGYFYVLPFNLGGIGPHDGVGTVSLLNATGVTTSSISIPSYSSCCHHLGPQMNGSSFGTGMFTFTGVRTITTVTNFGGTGLSYYQMFFQTAGGAQQTTFSGGGGGNVPEPATLALLGGGLLGVAGLRRRRR